MTYEIHQHADGSRRQHTASELELWGVYLRGADEWHAAKSMWDAVKMAHITNADFFATEPSPNDPWFWATPDVWPFTPEEHAADLGQKGMRLS